MTIFEMLQYCFCLNSKTFLIFGILWLCHKSNIAFPYEIWNVFLSLGSLSEKYGEHWGSTSSRPLFTLHPQDALRAPSVNFSLRLSSAPNRPQLSGPGCCSAGFPSHLPPQTLISVIRATLVQVQQQVARQKHWYPFVALIMYLIISVQGIVYAASCILVARTNYSCS